jgi:membrane protein implicated in regulation of membrane protease activity
VILIIALIVALLFLPWPWDLVVIGLAAACETAIAYFGIRYTRRRRAQVGVQTMVGRTAEVTSTLAPRGQVTIDGSIWEAHSPKIAQVGETVRITRIDGLTLEVEPAPAA